MYRPRAYWLFAVCLVTLAMLSAARLQLEPGAESEEIDRHLFGECPSEASGRLVSYCSYCRTKVVRDSEGPADQAPKYDRGGGASSSSQYPYWANAPGKPIDDAPIPKAGER